MPMKSGTSAGSKLAKKATKTPAKKVTKKGPAKPNKAASKKAVGKASAKKAMSKSAAKKAVAKKTGAKRPTAARNAAAKKATVATSPRRSVAKNAQRATSGRKGVSGRTRADASTGTARSQTAAKRKTPLRASRPTNPVSTSASRGRRGGGEQAAVPKKVSAKVAARHFREALKAKQERVRLGPNYPPANPFTGRHDPVAADVVGGLDTHTPPPAAGPPAPEALTGANSSHGRGNQGMRRQK